MKEREIERNEMIFLKWGEEKQKQKQKQKERLLKKKERERERGKKQRIKYGKSFKIKR